jgi:hypothetical protein
MKMVKSVIIYKNFVKKAGQSKGKARGTAVNFELKIRTIPLKAGRLENMQLHMMT